MKAEKIVFVCRECGNTTAKWYGKCPSCGEWNTLDEQVVSHSAAKATTAREHNKAERFSELTTPNYLRSVTGMGELDRVLGGGLVDSTVVLLSGEPGIGKSTLLLQI